MSGSLASAKNKPNESRLLCLVEHATNKHKKPPDRRESDMKLEKTARIENNLAARERTLKKKSRKHESAKNDQSTLKMERNAEVNKGAKDKSE